MLRRAALLAVLALACDSWATDVPRLQMTRRMSGGEIHDWPAAG